MKRRAIAVALVSISIMAAAGARSANAQIDEGVTPNGGVEQKLELTAAQRSAIYAAVSNDRSKAATKQFPTVIGAEVPPMIELYALPDDVVAADPAAKLYEYTLVQDQVVLVDPTKMRVIGVIGPASPK
jgi:hypothetical protein